MAATSFRGKISKLVVSNENTPKDHFSLKIGLFWSKSQSI